jgi:hypothetical protein
MTILEHEPAGWQKLERTIEQWWPEVDHAITPVLQGAGFEGDSFLADVDFSRDMYGCGLWGCVWPTKARGWVVKVTTDPFEGPLTYTITQDRVLHQHPGVAYVLGIWQLPERSFQGFPSYAILREAILPAKQAPSDLSDAEIEELRQLLGAITFAAEDLNKALDRIASPASSMLPKAEYEQYWLDRLIRDQNKWAERLQDARDIFFTAQLADFVQKFYDRQGGALADIHIDNVGVRQFDLEYLDLYGHQPSDFWVAFDIGHSDVKDLAEVPLLRNPGRIPLL